MSEPMRERVGERGLDGAPGGEGPATVTSRADGEEAVRQALLRALAPHPGGVVLAVSGGMDSMALLHAAARWAPRQVAMVATFDHGSGAHATEAAALVAAEARRLGLAVVRERGRDLPPTEAAWRAARWAFLRRVAKGCRAPVATAHTRDDQAETVFQRLLRGSGTRGLAGLAAPSSVVRPWLALPRAAVRGWGAAQGVPWLEDPANTDRRYQRVRVRLDWLPAAERADPGVVDWLVALGERAAAWRREVEALVDTLGVEPGGRRLRVPAAPLRRTSAAGRAVLWQALAGRVGVALDATGTRALVGFTTGTRRGAQLQLAGGARALCLGEGRIDAFELRAPGASRAVVPWDGHGALPPRAGGFRFRRVVAGTAPSPDSPWEFPVPADASVRVRPWRPGDRIRTAGAPAGRRVTRYLAEARIPAADRPAWPVVLLDGAVAWIPGICRSRAAPPRPGWSAPTWYRCELLPD
jgi:tRNA(Ile)-lysidine synthase